MLSKKTDSILGIVFLLITSIVWGLGFVAQSIGTEVIGPFSFNAARFALGGVVLVPFYLIIAKLQNNKVNSQEEIVLLKKSRYEGVKNGVSVGVILMAGANFQQFGMFYTTAGKAGFISALYIIMVPIIYVCFGFKIRRNVWLGIILSVIGMYCLSFKDNLTVNFGDMLLFISAFIYSWHIISIDKFSKYSDSVLLSMIQFFTASILSFIFAFVFDKPYISQFISAGRAILYSGILSGGVGYTLQIMGQRRVSPTVSSLIMSLESVFAVLGGWIILNEILSFKEMSGCILLFIAIILAQLPQKQINNN